MIAEEQQEASDAVNELPEEAEDSDETKTSDEDLPQPQEDSGCSVQIIRPDFPIHAGPNYDESVIGAVGASGSYSIAEQQQDDEGNIWGRLESDIGWIDLSMAERELASDSVPLISAYIVTTELPPLEADRHYIQQGDGYADTILFQTSFELTDLQLWILEYREHSYYMEDCLVSVDSLTWEDPFAADLIFFGDMTTYVVSFYDEEGIQHFYTLSISGRNGSLVVQPFDPFEEF